MKKAKVNRTPESQKDQIRTVFLRKSPTVHLSLFCTLLDERSFGFRRKALLVWFWSGFRPRSVAGDPWCRMSHPKDKCGPHTLLILDIMCNLVINETSIIFIVLFLFYSFFVVALSNFTKVNSGNSRSFISLKMGIFSRVCD